MEVRIALFGYGVAIPVNLQTSFSSFNSGVPRYFLRLHHKLANLSSLIMLDYKKNSLFLHVFGSLLF